MKTINCFVGVLKAGLNLPPNTFVRGGKTIADCFREGSITASGLPDIDLVVDDSRKDKCRISSQIATDTFQLQKALSKLTGNLPITGEGVDNIGLIFADRFSAHDTVWGLMFDYGFNPQGQEAVGGNFIAVPREGCAVFLDPIRAARISDADFHDEVFFTAVHELGHVFNLWHIEDPKCFLSTSNPAKVFTDADKAYQFHPDHIKFLAQCSSSKFVRPGGSPWEVRGMVSPQGQLPAQAPRPYFGLDLIIDMAQREFWNFEPVELEIRLCVAAGVEKTFTVPDSIDPGYPEFRIMIENPLGERYLYRSPRHYCLNPAVITVAPDQGFERDISIFGQAGGYTFQSPGVHRIWALFSLPGGELLKSNELDVNVLPASPDSEEFCMLRSVLTQPRHAKLLYHRSGKPHSKRSGSWRNWRRRQTGPASRLTSITLSVG